jgi:hypothetical protein
LGGNSRGKLSKPARTSSANEGTGRDGETTSGNAFDINFSRDTEG